MSRLVTLGVPMLAAEQTADAAAALAGVLERRLGTPVSVPVAASYGELEDDLAEGQVDFAWLPPYEAAWLSAHVDVRVLLRASRGGKPSYHSLLFTRAKGGPANLAELAGRPVAWVHRRSASGYLVPAAHLAEKGIEPATPPRFHGSHEAVVRAVLAGEADAGATFATVDDATVADAGADPPKVASASWERLREVASGAELRPLVALGPIPSDALCAWPGTSRAVRDELVRAILEAADDAADAAVLDALFGTPRFVRAAPGDESDVLDRALDTLSRQRRS